MVEVLGNPFTHALMVMIKTALSAIQNVKMDSMELVLSAGNTVPMDSLILALIA
jgi:hypothetical protein